MTPSRYTGTYTPWVSPSAIVICRTSGPSASMSIGRLAATPVLITSSKIGCSDSGNSKPMLLSPDSSYWATTVTVDPLARVYCARRPGVPGGEASSAASLVAVVMTSR